MARRRKGQAIHGWLVVDKPAGMSSNAVVGRVRRALNAAKVGHGGTLDPLATGLLPIALGEATKTVAYVMDGAKAYRFTLRFGEERDTDDAEGDVTATSPVRPDRTEIEAVLPRFLGPIVQVPPAYSAIKVDGRRAYKLARDGEDVVLEPRTVRIDRLILIDMPAPDRAVFEVACGKGAYMRALGRDIARALDSRGHIEDLRRTAVGPFTLKDAISLETLEQLGHSAPPEGFLRPVETVLDDIPALALTDDEARRMRNGQGVSLLRVAGRNPLADIEQGSIVRAMSDGRLVALARIEDGEVRPFRVMNL